MAPERTRARTRTRSWVWALLDPLILHAAVLGLWAGLALQRRRDARLQGALRGFAARIAFCCRSSSRELVFGNGRVATQRRGEGPADYELQMDDPLHAFKTLARSPGDTAKLLAQGRLRQRGNLGYLLRFGYVASLLQTGLQGRRTSVAGRLTCVAASEPHPAQSAAPHPVAAPETSPLARP